MPRRYFAHLNWLLAVVLLLQGVLPGLPIPSVRAEPMALAAAAVAPTSPGTPPEAPAQSYSMGPATAIPNTEISAHAALPALNEEPLPTVPASNDIVPQIMPALRGIQSDLFTGAATIQHEIPLPTGAGGFTPRLALQFNSRSRQDDQGTSSLLGTGWNLTLDSWVAMAGFWRAAARKPTIWRIDGVSYTEAGDHLVEAPDWRINRNGWQAADAYAPEAAIITLRRRSTI